MSKSDYNLVIGIEVHAELSTKTKIFCSCENKFGAKENTNVCPVCLGYPGALPVLNGKVVEYAIKAGLALNCEIEKNSKNDRKNYFYPDTPKSYQISQFDKPLCKNGYIEIEDDNGNLKKINIERIHIEDDSGKLSHSNFSDSTLVDFNRAGVPLIEIVSGPDIRSAKESDRYLKKLKSILEYIEVSDCKMEQGSFRADVNISVNKIGEPFGTRHEVKNMNSFKAIERLIEYEKSSQIEMNEKGEKIYQETMRWDEISGRTFSMREKEDANDYRYFPEPDLAKITLTDDYIEEIRMNLPELPEKRKIRYMEKYNLSEKDANILISSKYISDLFEKAGDITKKYKAVCNILNSDIAKTLNEEEIDPRDIPFSAEDLASLVDLIDKDVISSAIAKYVIKYMFAKEGSPEKIIKSRNLIQNSNEDEIKEIVMEILSANKQSIIDYKNGKDRALGFLVGQAMKKTQGKANPKMLNKMFIEEISKID